MAEALHWATDTRDPFNSCHDHITFGSNMAVADWFGVPGGYLAGESEWKHQNVYEGTERGAVWAQNQQSLRNSLVICEFTSMPGMFFHPPEMDIRVFESKLMSAITGVDTDVDELWQAGERIWNLRRAIMVLREDRHRNDDKISHDLLGGKSKIDIKTKEALKSQFLSEPLDMARWEVLKDRYYQLRGWDVTTGVPARAKLEELGMKDVADKLRSIGKLG